MNRIQPIQLTMLLLVFSAHAAVIPWVTQRTAVSMPAYVPGQIAVSLLSSELPEHKVMPAARAQSVPKSMATPIQQIVSTHDMGETATQAVPMPLAEPQPQIETVASNGAVATVAAQFDADYLQNPAPKYPLLSSRLREEGTVYLRVHVHIEGYAINVAIETSSGFARLDQAGLDAVRQWRFVPARQGVRTLSSWVIVPINFYLKG